jgi:hypothetical protein
MQFVNPGFLWALLLVAIPVIIHLFYFRRYKRVLFSDTRFLNEIKEQRASRNKLKHLLVLLSRIMAIIFLVLAFAQPFIPLNKGESAAETVVSIFVDNSFSMYAEGKGQTLFDEAKFAARSVVNAYSDNTRFQILTHDFEGRHQRLVSKSEALNLISEINISAASQHYNTIFDRQRNLLTKEDASKTSFIISDFQENKKLFENDPGVNVKLLPLKPVNVRNINVDSVWFEAPVQLMGNINKLIVRLRNEGSQDVSGNFQLSVNGVSKSVVNYNIPASSYSLDTLSFTITSTGWNKGKISLNDYPVTFDDNFYFAFFVEEEVRVLNIHATGRQDRIFRAIFSELDNVAYSAVNSGNINYNELSNYHFIILEELKDIPSGLTEALKVYVQQGGSVLLIPAVEIELSSYNSLLSALNAGVFSLIDENSRSVSELNYSHPVVLDLFERRSSDIKLPQVFKSRQLKTGTYTSEEKVMTFKNGDSFLSSFDYEFGKLYVVTASLDRNHSDFISNALFAPMVYKMAILGVRNPEIFYFIESNILIRMKDIPASADAVVKMKNEEIEIIPQKMVYGGRVMLNVKGDLLSDGFYELKSGEKSESEWVALNYNRDESRLRYYSAEYLKERFPYENVSVISGNIDKVSETVRQLEQGKTFWKLCIVLSLLFLAFEILLLRFLPG